MRISPRAKFPEPRRFLLLFLLLSFLSVPLHAQSDSAEETFTQSDSGELSIVEQEEDESTSAPTNLARRDSSELVERLPAADRLQALRGDDDLDYTERPDDSWVAQLETWLDETVGSLPWKTILEVVAFAGLAVCLGLLFYSSIQSFGRRGAKLAPVIGAEEAEEERIDGIEFVSEIDRAIARGDYRRASRLLYLSLLKQLSDAGRIVWKPEKTNHDYLRELGSGDLARQFARATLLFDYIWYGDFHVDGATFSQVRGAFENVAVR